MTEENKRISNFQAAMLMLNTIIGVGVLSLPSTLAEKLGTSGWISLVITGAIVAIPVAMMTKLMSMYEGKNIVEISSLLIGKPLTYITLTIMVIHMLEQSSVVTRIFGEVIKMFLLFSTPIEVIIVTILLTAVYTVRSGVEAMGRLSVVVMPFIVVSLLVFCFVLIPDLDFSNLLPVFKTSPVDILKSIPSTFFSFGGIEFLLIYMYYSKNPKSAMKYNLGAAGVITVLYLLSFFLTLARFGEKGLVKQLWPLLSLTKAIQFPSAFIENIDGIVMAIWVIVAFTTLMSAIFSASILIGKMCRSEEYKYLALPLVPIIYFTSLVLGNVALVYDYGQIFAYIFATFASIIYPTLLFIIAVLKKKGETKKNENNM